MIKKNGIVAFGFTKETGIYNLITDTIDDMKKWKNGIPVDRIIKHIETLDPAYACSGGHIGVDAFTGEEFYAAMFDDGQFSFPIEVLRYLKRGDIHGVPKEYEQYIAEKLSA